ncbi:MAG: hypothetical protein K5663_06745 [Clostridiales bacterium]|nr:hypothetical protein [Clostridiales bacterium]
MKKLAIYMLILALICALLLGAYALTATLKTDAEIKTVPASSRAEEFVRLKGENALSDIGGYYFADISVKVKNLSPFSAEWITLTAVLPEEDEALEGSGALPVDIDGMGSGELSLTVLTRSPEKLRTAWVDYYILGRYHRTEAQLIPAQ